MWSPCPGACSFRSLMRQYHCASLCVPVPYPVRQNLYPSRTCTHQDQHSLHQDKSQMPGPFTKIVMFDITFRTWCAGPSCQGRLSVSTTLTGQAHTLLTGSHCYCLWGCHCHVRDFWMERVMHPLPGKRELHISGSSTIARC